MASRRRSTSPPRRPILQRRSTSRRSPRSTTGSSSSRRRILNRSEVNQDEETHHRDSGEGHSSRSHSLPHGHHNYVVHGPRSSPTLLNEHRESLSKVLVRNGKDFYYISHCRDLYGWPFHLRLCPQAPLYRKTHDPPPQHPSRGGLSSPTPSCVISKEIFLINIYKCINSLFIIFNPVCSTFFLFIQQK